MTNPLPNINVSASGFPLTTMAHNRRVACFHGSGSNQEIFAIQCRQLQKELGGELNLVFFNAPFESKPGPDVLPAFANLAPFRSWFRLDTDGAELADGSGFDDRGCGGLDRVREMMRAIAPAEEWFGAIGFSQGTRVVGGLLLDQKRRAQAKAWGDNLVPLDIQLKFGVLCVGGGPPMLSSATYGTSLPLVDRQRALTSEDRIDLPTLHYLGLRDINLARGRQVLQEYYSSSARLWELDYHHAMPWIKSENEEFASLILELYYSSTRV